MIDLFRCLFRSGLMTSTLGNRLQNIELGETLWC